MKKISLPVHSVSYYLLIIFSFSLVLRLPIFLGNSTKIIWVVSSLFLSIILVINKRLYLPRWIFYYLLLFFILMLVSQIYWMQFDDPFTSIKITLYQTCYVLVFCVSYTLLRSLSIEEAKSFFKVFFYGAIVIFSTELYFRVAHPELILPLKPGFLDSVDKIVDNVNFGIGLDNFYSFKFASFMAHDSNYIGFSLIPIIIILHEVKRFLESTIFYSIVNLTLVALLFSTISRAAMITLAFILFFYFLRAYINRYRWPFLIIASFVSLLALFPIVHTVLNVEDESFQTKIEILESITKISDQTLSVMLLGAGNVVGPYLYSYTEGGYAHLLLPIILGMIGVLGLFAYLYFWLLSLMKFRFYGVYIFLAFLMLGMSLADPWEPLYIFALCVSVVINKEYISLKANSEV
ncbi:hypothetical protein DR996_07230 [Vibrio owensii]|nr:hypothetical protein DR996_07230 [Vibrio owensii]